MGKHVAEVVFNTRQMNLTVFFYKQTSGTEPVIAREENTT